MKRERQQEELKLQKQLDELNEAERQHLKVQREQAKMEESTKEEHEIADIAEELKRITEDAEERVLKRNQTLAKRGMCRNRLKGGTCQLYRWFGRSCDNAKMKTDCKASCGYC